MPTTRPIIIGAGPAGLSAAYELLQSDVESTILEADSDFVGGISRTARYKGFRFDIGGHRFYSKNREIQQLWTEWLGDELLLVPRLSRILYDGKFFDYPLKARNAFLNLGLWETLRCIASWLRAQAKPVRPEASFEDWVVNRFGARLYSIFFRTYTEKVWGIPCREISADWAAQRIKDLNLFKACLHAIGWNSKSGPTITTLIDEFRYPRLGPGMMWERLSENVISRGCRLKMGERVETVTWEPGGVISVTTSTASHQGDAFLCSMPMRSLVQALDPPPPDRVLEAAEKLRYRDYLTVVLILDVAQLFPDNWLYIHEPRVRMGRIQNYKNWSADMVPDSSLTSLGLEYFCDAGDSLWKKSDSELVEMGFQELCQLGLAEIEQLRDGTVLRMPKAYPVYDEGYQDRVDLIREFVQERLPNLQLIGRNGMHRYNNQDHAMWTGILGARNILGLGDYDLWKVNADAEYLEAGEISEARSVPIRKARRR